MKKGNNMTAAHARPGAPAMVVHTFTIDTVTRSAATVVDRATCGLHVATSTRSCADRRLARMMLASGEVDGAIEARGVDGRLRYTVRSLAEFAKWTLTEKPRPSLNRYVERPDFGQTSDD